LLEWFLAIEDFGDDDALIGIAYLTERFLPDSLEPGDLRATPAQRARARTMYGRVQTDLRAAIDLRSGELKSRTDRRIGKSFALLIPYLADVTLEVARNSLTLVELPEQPAYATRSLVGELALATFYKLLRAKSGRTCRYCHRIELFDDVRRRVTCRRPECIADYRSQWKRKHPHGGERSPAK
jgi:hypothetical protein